MPGSSLWLIPPPSSPLYEALQQLISPRVPSLIPSTVPPPHFSPHVTLSADNVPPFLPERNDTQSPQIWFDSLPLPLALQNLCIEIKSPQPGNPYFRKLSLRILKSPELIELAAHALSACDGDLDNAREWAMRENEDGEASGGGYGPHLSLMYSHLPTDEIRSKLEAITAAIREARDQTPGSERANGGEIWLVPTEKPIAEWKPIARRFLPKTVEWRWET